MQRIKNSTNSRLPNNDSIPHIANKMKTHMRSTHMKYKFQTPISMINILLFIMIMIIEGGDPTK